MAFDDVSAEAYERFMGRFSTPLAPLFADLALDAVSPLGRVLDVGCGPGMLTAELVARLGEEGVAAADPAADLVAATARRFARADVRRAPAESLPWEAEAIDATLAQLVVQFMSDPRVGVTEMRRVTRPGGRVAVCVWDHGGSSGPLSPFWRTAARVDPQAPGEGQGFGTHRGQLVGLLRDVGLEAVEEHQLTVTLAFATFEEWWEPYTGGVGPVGDYLSGLAPATLASLVEELRSELGGGPFEVVASAWAARGTVPDGGGA